MSELGAAAALLLGGLFAWAGAAKLANRRRTADGFAAFGLPAPALLATAVPLAELALAAGFLTVPPVAAAPALVLLAAFSAVLVRAIRSGAQVGCGCFGSTRAEPVTAVELVRNALLAVAAVAAAFAETPPSPGLGAVAVVAGLALVAGRRRPRTAPRTT